MNLSAYVNLLTLLRNAIFRESAVLSAPVDWQQLMQQAHIHGVEPLVYDAALRLPADQAPDKALATQMKQVCLYQMQQQQIWLPRIRKAVEALRQADVEPVLLKGFGLAELYPKPYLRSWGDADIWVGVQNYHAGCKAVREVFPEAIHHDEEYEELKHYSIVFPDGNPIELHRVSMDFPTKSEEKYWQTLEVPAMHQAFSDEQCQLAIVNCQLVAPAEPFNLLFVFMHAWEHFCGTGMPLKQVLDIALLVQRDYLPLADADKQQVDAYLRTNLHYFRLHEAWQLVAYVVEYVTGITMPMALSGAVVEQRDYRSLSRRQSAFLQRVLTEGMTREKVFKLGGADRYDERERVKRIPVWRRKLMTLQSRLDNARFLRQYTPAYARHALHAAIMKGLRRTIRRERMIDY
ncbi:MAG: nucleotidyltransferase family protein [Paludibacteraceae bacterium]|nr:nucleotidyltransferase family protein [Paludibacteraceae bacterium]